uniref:Putative secreted peptide n=1 Tax=Anopheles braziliensis TaxID=58242 RepID=A0A2M3ZSL4_9DIPT
MMRNIYFHFNDLLLLLFVFIRWPRGSNLRRITQQNNIHGTLILFPKFTDMIDTGGRCKRCCLTRRALLGCRMKITLD